MHEPVVDGVGAWGVFCSLSTAASAPERMVIRALEPTMQEVHDLLRDPHCPRWRHSERCEAVPVLGFIAFARSRGLATSQLETVTDACVTRLGGKRRQVPSVDGRAKQLLRRFTGYPVTAHDELWLIPAGA
jgi:hypothetical protein